MLGVSVAHESFVMATAGAQRPRPAGVAIVFGIDMAAAQKVGLLLAIDAGGDVSQGMRVGIDEAMTRRNIARRSDAHQSQPRSAGVRFIYALAQLRQSIADVRKPVRFSAHRIFEILLGQDMKLFQHAVHALLVDSVKLVRRRRYGREADFVKTEVLLKVSEDFNHIGDARGESDPRGYRTRA